MFEQSVLTPLPTNKAWSVPFSIAAEVITIGLLMVVPLIYTNQLPGIHLNMGLVAPPPPAGPEPASRAEASISQPKLTVRAIPFVLPRDAADHVPIEPASIPFAPPNIGVAGSVGNAAGGNLVDAILRTSAPPQPASAVSKPASAPSGPVHVGGQVQEAKLIHKVIPTYPALAKQARISGVVHLLGVIAKDGTIENLQVISGHPMLVRAALDAVRQWSYRPTLLNGQPVEVIAPIEISFILE